LALGSTTIYLLIYFINVFIVIFLLIVFLVTKGKYGEKTARYFIKDLFFNIIISMTMEFFFEFIVYGLLNFYTFDKSTSGEVLGVLVSLFSIFLASVFVPFAMMWAIFTKD